MGQDSYDRIPSSQDLFDRIKPAERGDKFRNATVESVGNVELLRNQLNMLFMQLRLRPYLVIGGVIFFALFMFLGWFFKFGVIFSFVWAIILSIIGLISGGIGQIYRAISWLLSSLFTKVRSKPE